MMGFLQGCGPYTVFVPSDKAFKAAGYKDIDCIDGYALQSLLRNHIVSGKYMACDLQSFDSVNAINGKCLTISGNGKKRYINGAKIIRSDLIGSNGVIHVVDKVIQN